MIDMNPRLNIDVNLVDDKINPQVVGWQVGSQFPRRFTFFVCHHVHSVSQHHHVYLL